MNICSTRDTEVMTMEGEDTEETEAAAEPRHHDEEDHDHDIYTPKEEAEWDFKTGTCVFRLQWVKHKTRHALYRVSPKKLWSSFKGP